MIIREIKLNKKFFFIDEILILTDTGKISLNAGWDQDLVNKINSVVKDFNIESANDFSRLSRALEKVLDRDKYAILEKTIFNNIKYGWRFFDPALRQVPRPMNVVLKKNKGIREFVVFSLNTKDFPAALAANHHVTDFLIRRIKNPDEMKEEDILMLIREAIDREHELVEFELRIGVVFNNYENGKYVYPNKTLDSEQQYDFVSSLIKNYSIAYVENPFSENNLELYKKLATNYRKKSLITMNSKINEYSIGIDKKAFNTVVAKFDTIANFKSDVDFFREKNLNIVAEDASLMDVVVGLGIPLIKIRESKESNDSIKRLNIIIDEISGTKVVGKLQP